MPLNIKNEATHALARELADATGESLTEAVTVAVRERLERLRLRAGLDDARVEAALVIARDIRERIDLGDDDPTAFLYDEDGLPR